MEHQRDWDFDDYYCDDDFDHRSWAREQPLRPKPASDAPNSRQSPNHEQDTDGGFGDLAWNDEGPSGQF